MRRSAAIHQGGNLGSINPTNTLKTRADLSNFLADVIHLVLVHSTSHLQVIPAGYLNSISLYICID